MAVETIWSDIHHALIVDSQGAIKVVENIQSVITSVANILRTHKGERVMLPTFGGGMNDAMFESMDKDLFDLFSEGIRREIEAWDNRVSVDSVSIKLEHTKNSMSVRVIFTIIGYDDIFEQTVNLVGG